MSTAVFVVLIATGYIIYTVDKKQKNFPVPVALLLTGIALSFIPFFSSVRVTEHMIYSVFLPGLLFVSAYRFSAHALRKNAGIIGFLSTAGLLVTAGLLSCAIYAVGNLFFPITFLGAMLAASILTPTDPVSVVSILKQSINDPSVSEVVDGESMINDGTSVVLFTMLAGMFVNGASFHPGVFVADFFKTAAGGAGIGFSVSWLLSKAVHLAHHREPQVMLSIVMAYGSFQLAEHFGFSGVLATVTAGILLSWEFSHTHKEDHYREMLEGFWGVAEPVLLTLVFLLIGIEAAQYLLFDYWVLAFLLFLASVAVRFLVVKGTMLLFPGWRQAGVKKAVLISFAGIRGTMSVFLLLTLNAMASGTVNNLLPLSYAIVIISLVVQSVAIYPLSKWMDS